MVWPIIIYALLSLVIAGSAAFNAGAWPGICALLTSGLVLAAAGGLKGTLLWGETAFAKFGGCVFATVLLGTAYWLSTSFSAQLFGLPLSGTAWGAIGFAVCFIFADRKLTGTPPARVRR
jgi:hypothetical protein